MLGSGGMARSYLDAFCAVRPIKSVKVYSPTKANREKYAKEMAEQHNIEVTAVDTPQEAVRGSDIISSCTDSMGATTKADWLAPGMFITDLGEEEVDDECLAKIDVKLRQGDSLRACQAAAEKRRSVNRRFDCRHNAMFGQNGVERNGWADDIEIGFCRQDKEVGTVVFNRCSQRRRKVGNRGHVFGVLDPGRAGKLREIKRSIRQRLAARSGVNPILDEKDRQITRRSGSDRNQRTHMHEQPAVAFDHEHGP
jgi:hypothetical protein